MQVLIKIIQEHKYGQMLGMVLRIGLGLLFIYASLDKIWNPGLFAKSISNYRILPLPLLHISAIILPWLEFLCGLALILNKYPRAANAWIAGLLLVFIMAVISAMSRGLDFNCGCFNVNEATANLGFGKIAENIGLLLCAGFLELQFRTNQK